MCNTNIINRRKVRLRSNLTGDFGSACCGWGCFSHTLPFSITNIIFISKIFLLSRLSFLSKFISKKYFPNLSLPTPSLLTFLLFSSSIQFQPIITNIRHINTFISIFINSNTIPYHYHITHLSQKFFQNF